MNKGCFHFIKNEYFEDFKDSYLMTNKEKVGNEIHNWPCFYAFFDEKTKLFWMIPFSSKVEKFKKIFEKELISKVKKVLTLYRKGIKLIFPDVISIEKKLIEINK